MTYEGYRDLATSVAGKSAINLEKDAVDGIPKGYLDAWGYGIDLTGVAEGGPLAATVSAKPDKVHKFAQQLSDALKGVRARKLLLKSLEKMTGLAVWLAQTNSLLQALLPYFYNALNSAGTVYVEPMGSAEAVNRV